MSNSASVPVIVRAPKRIDCCTAAFLAQDLETKIQAGEGIVLDLSATQFLDPEGTKVILEGLMKSRQQGTKFALKGVKPQVKVILELSGILQHFKQK
ncbi:MULTISPECIES: STAS domain-containing protein [Trichocoleus]|uniref:STAS domain-containing protein n=1 Tax=Trichocoleus desertorum GB2-A4 TaxID=2933944 RepID=A0ABV0JD17_9CYAN|nr:MULTISPECIES: STAS domain-containing protein [unclassified Trichocoleus]MBD1864327.1 STAS domain-containing protein [Trichocoleus sp. FACHB-46]MBD2123485.1 STAS domain-containing protein [Trichocoleus sp. FACHB-262]